MPAKKPTTTTVRTVAVPETLEDLAKLVVNMSTLLDTVAAKVNNWDIIPTHLEKLEEKLAAMETKLNEALEENTILKRELAAKTKIVGDQQLTINNLLNGQNKTDQYMRSWSTRILNIPITAKEEQCPFAMKKLVYELAFLPVLTGALSKGAIPFIPSDDQLLEVAHPLPGKPGTRRPIIARFRDRNFCAVCMRHRREFATRIQSTTRGGGTTGPSGADGGEGGPSGRGGFAFPFYEDLTPANFAKMKELAGDSRVQSCWTVNGQIRYKRVNSTDIMNVQSAFDPIEHILA
jgi:hypothetical protein